MSGRWMVLVLLRREKIFSSLVLSMPNDFIIRCFRITEMVILLHTNED